MENVKGLLSARYKEEGMFERIITDLQDPLKALTSALRTTSTQRYKLLPVVESVDPHYPMFGNQSADVSQFIVRCERHGIPQRRHRLILVGIREDMINGKALLLPTAPQTTTCQAIADLPRLRSGLSSRDDSRAEWLETLTRALKEKWYKEVAGNDAQVAHVMATGVAAASEAERDKGSEFVAGLPFPKLAAEWFRDQRLSGFLNHSARAHIADDLKRYLFSSAYAHVHGESPTLREFPEGLLPEHQNVSRAIEDGVFLDRFRVQIATEPSTTITAHISKDGHYYIHYDPSQCRSLTVREAARLQTFPDNYFFCGPRTAQYHQVGNAVPPLLARQLAHAISQYLD